MSRYDDPRWYEEQHFNRPAANKPAYDDLNPAYQANNNTFQWPDSPRRVYTLPEEPRSYQIVRQIFIGSALVIIAFLAGWFSHQYLGNALTQNSQSQKYSQLFQQAWNIVDQKYVDRKAVNYQNMSYAAINAMVSSLHDKGHTYFLTPDQSKAFDQQYSGKFVGIGISLSQDLTSKKFIINSTIAGSPAEKAGLRRNDIILSVNGVGTQGKTLDAVSKLMAGKVGTEVALIIQHPGAQQPQTFHIVRAEITEQNVIMHYIAQDRIAHIQIVQFADGVSDQLKNSINTAKSMGATKIILDLRNNGGGVVQEAINTVSDFVKSGNVYLEKDSSGHVSPIPVTGNTLDTRIPLVVLVNASSASAAEIVPGALKDSGRATLIGAQTFGTGTVMNRFDLSDGSVLWVGVDEWLTPKGQFIRDHGITPNITVKMPANASILTPNDENVQNMTLQQIQGSGDSQLMKAIQYLDQGH
ncbi:MAG: S41 family peptidase [Ktedonobacteraceae bacterium]|nr:S41 family peptidase [Ktedonobacteraceae bacterium]